MSSQSGHINAMKINQELIFQKLKSRHWKTIKAPKVIRMSQSIAGGMSAEGLVVPNTARFDKDGPGQDE